VRVPKTLTFEAFVRIVPFAVLAMRPIAKCFRLRAVAFAVLACVACKPTGHASHGNNKNGPATSNAPQPKAKSEKHTRIETWGGLVQLLWSRIGQGLTPRQLADALGAEVKPTEAATTWRIVNQTPAATIDTDALGPEQPISWLRATVEVAAGLSAADLTDILGPFTSTPGGKTSIVIFSGPTGDVNAPYFSATLLASHPSPESSVIRLNVRPKL